MPPVAVPKMTHHDSPARAPALAEGSSRQWGPALWLGDSHDGSPESVAQCQSERMALVAPARPPKGAQQGQLTLEHLILDQVGHVVTRLQGHASGWPSVRERRVTVRFDPAPCQGCPSMNQCPGDASAQAKQDARWQYTHERVARRHRRLTAQESAFTAPDRWRAGMEATRSRLQPQMHLAHLRVRGMAAVCSMVFRRALGLNVLRVAASQQA
jgi:hypothetical protein